MNQPAATVPSRPASGWERFLAARTSDAFCSAWLALICEKFPEARMGAVLVEASDSQAFVPIAVWPAASGDMGRMGAAVQRALAERRPVLVPATEEAGVLHIALPVMVNERVAAAVVIEAAMTSVDAAPLLRELHWGSAWLSNLLGKRDADAAAKASERSLGILETIATALRHTRLQQALFELTTTLRQRFACSRVAIGLLRDARVRVVALSEAATFEKSSPMVRAYADAMAEAFDLAQPVEAAIDADGALAGGYRAHAALLRQVAAQVVLSVPVDLHARTVAVITLERDQGPAFDADECQWLETFSALFAPVIAQRRDAERNSVHRLGTEASRLLKAVFGPRHLVWKLATIAVAAVAAVLVWWQVPYRVSAKTVSEGSIQRVAAAPFEGFLAASFVRAGDTVRKDQLLAQLDDHELRVEQARWASQRDQYQNKLREALANHDLSAVRVVTAQLDEAQAQLDLAQDKLARTRIRAPYDGVIVSGDLSQQTGTPLEAGKKLFEIAPLHSYRIIMQVDEHDIAQIRVGQPGELVMTGLAGDPLPFKIARIMPVATSEDGKNFFRVEARLDHASALLLPGMEGVSKVAIGRRRMGWVLLHGFLDWLRVSLWRWSP
jgi:RND family efflux transporter MFP subunit